MGPNVEAVINFFCMSTYIVMTKEMICGEHQHDPAGRDEIPLPPVFVIVIPCESWTLSVKTEIIFRVKKRFSLRDIRCRIYFRDACSAQ